ncbi:MAG: hypothetical protein MJ089_02660 [Ruminococcus sp.]|nr:hypothetical protein [Ruminococcus sp.]
MQNERLFEDFLSQEPSITSAKAVTSRMYRARKAEEILGISLDEVVADDDRMYDSLMGLKPHENPAHTPMQNAVRKYYKFKNHKEFPQLRYYKR